MVFRILSSELQEKSENELGEIPSRIADELDHIRQWLLTQNHLQCRTDDQWLISFLRCSKFDIEKTKIKIDNFYRTRTLVPKFFENRDPFQSEIQEILKAGLVLPLPITKEADGPRIIFSHFSGTSHTKINILTLLKVYFMIMDILILEDDNFNIGGLYTLTDCEDLPLSWLLQVTPNLLRKIVYCMQHCYPVRFKECHNVNSPLGMEFLVKIMKSFMSKKLRNRFFVHGKKKNLDHILDKTYMPQQHGGANGRMDELTEHWKNKIESYRNWFLEDDTYRSIESLRPDKSTSTGVFGTLGSLNPFTPPSSEATRKIC